MRSTLIIYSFGVGSTKESATFVTSDIHENNFLIISNAPSIAHARLMFRDRVTLEDAVTVLSVMESSMQVSISCT